MGSSLKPVDPETFRALTEGLPRRRATDSERETFRAAHNAMRDGRIFLAAEDHGSEHAEVGEVKRKASAG